MALEIKLNQKLSQSLVMTPQLQQAIKLLQLGRMEYLEVIERELLENPVLEDLREVDSQTFQESADNTPSTASNSSVEGESEPSKNESSVSKSDGELPSDFFSAQTGTAGKKRSDFGGERPSLEATVSSPEGLSSHLLWQLRTERLDSADYEIVSQILGNIDRNGYLACTVAEIAAECSRAEEDVLKVLSLIQTLDPPGIAAQNLQECLLIQLEQLGMRNTLAGKLVESYLSELELQKYGVIAKAEGLPVEDVYEAIKEIKKLEPRPGRPFVDESPIYITPDIYVRKVGRDYVLSLNDSGMPKLRLNPYYQELLSTKTESKSNQDKDKEYLQDKVRSASWLIKSIRQRQQTIYRVTESIMKHQRDFLDKGVSSLKPLILREIAADVGMHESTVSRVTTNKYVHTPQGIFELKFFFSSGLKSGNGEVSSESVKERIRLLIKEENPKKPLSDQALVNLLQAEGIDIARRTVAKYREMMNILSSSRRKRMF